MTSTAPLVTIFGGSGFVGRYVSQRMARRGWRVRVAVRRPNEAHFVRPYGEVGQVEPVQANLRDGPSTLAACAGADVAINCVGILAEVGPQKFASVQAEGAARVAEAAKEAGVGRFVHISAIGADADSPSAYARSKAEGEAAVREAFADAAILRPSIVFGTEDQFFNRFAAMARFSPALPLVGADTRFQPVHVEDVAEAAARCAAGEAPGGLYELGGPRVATFRELMELMLQTVRRRRLIVDLPVGLATVQAKALSLVQTLTAGLFVNNLITEDQIKLLGRDNVVAEGVKTFADLGISPTEMEAVLESYLWAHRPGGQYARITESAKKLRG
ncbi:MAG: complex I NDUFA9 subunit family protein [Pseudomonadota bacterium]